MSIENAHVQSRNDPQPRTHHTKEDALDTREFELLLEGCYRMDDYYAIQCQFVVLVAGRLGLRAGEIAHMDESWIDWRRNMIEVPAHERCTNSHDDDLCAYCRGCAAQKAECERENVLDDIYAGIGHGDELEPGGGRVHAADLPTGEDYYHTMWSPKTDAAARDVPFDADPRAEIIVERFFERFDEYPHGRQSVNRRVKRAARFADEVSEEDVYPHCLRATAASFFAAKGLDVFALKSFMGWSDFQTAKCYISSSGERTAQAIRDIQV